MTKRPATREEMREAAKWYKDDASILEQSALIEDPPTDSEMRRNARRSRLAAAALRALAEAPSYVDPVGRVMVDDVIRRPLLEVEDDG